VELFLNPRKSLTATLEELFAPPLLRVRYEFNVETQEFKFIIVFSVDKRIAAVKSVTQLCIALIVHALYLKKVHEKFILGNFFLRLEKNRQLDSSKITLKKVKLPKDQISRTIKCF